MKKALLFLAIFAFHSCKTLKYNPEKQITNDLDYNHNLDNNDNFSPDDKWLVYDTRTEKGGIASSAIIEKVNIESGEKKILYTVKNNQEWGPGVGAVSYSPIANKVAFIHGLNSVTKINPYQQWRRTGVIVDEENLYKPIFMDARDISFPFTKGALRGGTHRHEWSGDGQMIGFTYNDAVMENLERLTNEKHNLRTIGVSKKLKPVQISKDSLGENISGEWFSSLIVKATPNPRANSDEISNAAGDSWVGKAGYLKPNGQRQIARAFIGTVRDINGNSVDEVFIVDIPENLDIEVEGVPLEGTKTDLPSPPKGAVQKRLTFTANSEQPGCTGIVRSTSNGNLLAFLAKDYTGIKQIFTISPLGGKPEQITFHDTNVEGFVRWHPSGKSLFYVYAGSINRCFLGKEPFENRVTHITKPTNPSPSNLVLSHDGKTIAYNRVLTTAGNSTKQIFIVNLD